MIGTSDDYEVAQGPLGLLWLRHLNNSVEEPDASANLVPKSSDLPMHAAHGCVTDGMLSDMDGPGLRDV